MGPMTTMSTHRQKSDRHAASRIVFLKPLLTACFLAGGLSGQATKLSYMVEALGSAKTVQLVPGGAEGSAWALGLRVSDNDWARWNLPAFPASASCTGLEFQARLATVALSDGKTAVSRAPASFQVRFQEGDGSEWQGEKLGGLEAGWKKFTVAPEGFTYFRGRDTRKGTAFNIKQAVQVQFVLIGAAPGEGVDLDSVRLGPSGLAWTFETAEHRPTTTAAEALEARASMIYGSLMAEKERLESCARWARDAASGLQKLLDSHRSGETFEAFTAKQGKDWQGRVPAYLDAPPGGVRAYEPKALPMDGAVSKPALPLTLALDEASRWKSSTLYLAKPQESPSAMEEDGKPGIALNLRFTDAGKQVIFMEGPTFAAVDFSPFRYVDVLAKLDAAPLSETSPLCLRLISGENQAEFADFKAEMPLPTGKWTNIRFTLGKPFQGGGGYNGRKVVSFRFRFQNKEETAACFRFVVAQMRLVPPDAAQAAMDRALSAAYGKLAESKWVAWKELDALRLMRERIRSNAVVSAWLYQAQCATAVKPMAYPPSPGVPGLYTSARLSASGAGELIVRYLDPGFGVEGVEALWLDHQGAVLAKSTLAPEAANKRSFTASLRQARVRAWSPAYPYLYRVRVQFRGGAASNIEREIGFRNITLGSTPLSPTLRHAWGDADWEGSMLLNGQPYFPYGAYYGLPKGKNLGDVAPLLRELWVDALREYGFSFKPERVAFGDREGIGAYASIAPPYKNIGDWDDFHQVFADWTKRLETLGQELGRPSVLNWQVGNEVELDMWGASLADSCPEAPWLPLERAAVLARGVLPPAPITYVRAGALSPIPVLAGEDLSGINQYTGRYGGRITEIGSHLEQYARHARASCRSLGITEWNGPQYSWAANGIGSVTERGGAYYVQRYFETMIDTPGIGLSSEFTLNWVLWRTEDLTTRTREEEWKDRPPYEGFGGGYSADHVPLLTLEQVYRGEVFRAFRGMQSPLYALLRAPGDLVVAHAPDAKASAEALAKALAPFGRGVRTLELAPGVSLAGVDAHLVVLGGVARRQPAAVLEWEKAGVLDEALEGFPTRSLPLIERRLHPNFSKRGLVFVSGADEAARSDGVKALMKSAGDIAELWKREGAMVRVVALVDAKGASSYERLTFEFVGRGHILGGDDTRERLAASEFLCADGKRKPAWWNLNALILDTSRALETDEWNTVKVLAKGGVRIVISEPCLTANKAVADYLGVQVGSLRSLTEGIQTGETCQGPIPVKQLGLVQRGVLDRFQPGFDPKTLQVYALRGGSPLAWMENDRSPIAVKVERDGGNYAVLGYALGEVSALHRRVAVSGKSHSMYDRDTASGLERPARFALNLCLEGRPGEKILPRLRGVPQLTRGTVGKDERTMLSVRLFDMEGRVVRGAVVQARVQGMVQAKPQGQAGAYGELFEIAPGIYQIEVGVGKPDTVGKGPLLVEESSLSGEGLKAVSAQIRALAPGHIAWEGGCSAWVR